MGARRSWLRLTVGLMTGLSAANGAELDVTLSDLPREVVVHNPWPADAPTVYIVGLPDRDQNPVRLTCGVTLNGVRLTERLLSESVLILYPDGTGKWGYHAGFDIFREPDIRDGRRIDPRSLVEYDKWRYDPLQPVSVVGGDMNLLRLYDGRPLPSLQYEVAFPDPIRLRRLRISSNCDQLATPGVEVTVGLYADREHTKLLAEKKLSAEAGSFPVEFAGLDIPSVFVDISGRGTADTPVYLYWTFLEAELDASGLKLPVLSRGDNTLTITDDPDSSHRARVVLRWLEKPEAERIWDDFEADRGWAGLTMTPGSTTNGLAFTGTHFARIRFPATGTDYQAWRGFDPPLDLTGFNRLSLATRVRQGAPMQAILFGIRNGEGGYQYRWLRPGPNWTWQSFDISAFARDRVTALNVYFSAVPGYNHPEVQCEYDLDALCFTREEEPPSAPRPLPARVAQYHSPFEGVEAPTRQPPPLREWFPMGVYDGITLRPREEAVFLLDEMKRLHMNALYVSNGDLDGLARVLPLAEARGIRLIYQGGGDGALYYLHHPTAEARRGSLEQVILPTARARLPEFRGRWGLAAWSLTEEITPELSRELKPFYDLVRELAPGQPPTVLHNSLAAAVADLETNHPEVITHDFYPFFWAPTSGPSNPQRSIAAYRSHVSSYYRACREHGASLWMMAQSWASEETAPLDPPNYGYRTGMRNPQPGEIKLQGWVAIAEGATGLLFFAAQDYALGEQHLWTGEWEQTPKARAAGELFAQVARVAPLLCRLERDYREEGFVRVAQGSAIAHSFTKRAGYPGAARYIVLASLDGFGPQTVQLEVAGGPVYDLVERREVSAELKGLELEAGEGKVLMVGTPEEFAADCALLDSALTAG